MTSETDYPRQRTVAELLAEHGGGAPTGRRRRRRAAEEVEPAGAESLAVATPVATDVELAGSDWPEMAPEPDRSVLREPVPNDPTVGVTSYWDTSAAVGYGEPEPARTSDFGGPDVPSSPSFPTARPPRVESPTEQIPLITGGLPTRDVGRTGPMERLRRASPKWRDALDAVERSEREVRVTPPLDRPVEHDELDAGGPPTQAAAPLDLNELDDLDDASGLDERDLDERDLDERDLDERDLDERDLDEPGEPEEPEEEDEQPTRRVGTGRRPRMRRAAVAEPALDAPEIDLQPRRRLGRAAAESASAGPGWALVLAQWIVGALGGAALWIAFRFLWRSLPVVAFTAAALTTIGLIVLVRALLRSKDWRSTGLAVLVGLLLTVSPALLVLLDR